MLNILGQLGSFGPLLIILALSNLFLVFWYGKKLFGSTPDRSADINKIMILAVLALAIGALSHYMGFYSGLKLFGEFSTAMFAAGYAVSLLPLMFGIAVFIISTIFWLGLRTRLQSLTRSVNV